jgi:hypothetical protein
MFAKNYHNDPALGQNDILARPSVLKSDSWSGFAPNKTAHVPFYIATRSPGFLQEISNREKLLKFIRIGKKSWLGMRVATPLAT